MPGCGEELDMVRLDRPAIREGIGVDPPEVLPDETGRLRRAGQVVHVHLLGEVDSRNHQDSDEDDDGEPPTLLSFLIHSSADRKRNVPSGSIRGHLRPSLVGGWVVRFRHGRHSFLPLIVFHLFGNMPPGSHYIISSA